jgi:hypothetical protein
MFQYNTVQSGSSPIYVVVGGSDAALMVIISWEIHTKPFLCACRQSNISLKL